MRAPVVGKKLYQRLVKDADGELQHAQQVLAAPGPAIAQQYVVLLLDADAGEAAQDVKVIREFLELHEIDFPRAGLLLADSLESDGGITMAPAGVME
jgi:hypothetical protein